MAKAKFRYSVTLKKYPKGHGYRTHYATTKKIAKKIREQASDGKGYTIRKFKKPKRI